MHIHVLGFGAIGTLVSHYLRTALDPKHTIHIVHKSATSALHASRLPGLKLEVGGVTRTQGGFVHESWDPSSDHALRLGLAATKHRHSQSAAQPLEAPLDDPQETTQAKPLLQPNAGPIDSLIVATKANDAARGIQTLLPRLSANSTIVLLHNGMGVYEYLVENVFRNRQHRPHFVLSANTHGAFLKVPGHVVHTGIGSIELGIMPDALGRDFEASVDTSLTNGNQTPNLNDITPLRDDPDAMRYLSLRNTISALTSTTALDVSWHPLFDVQHAMHRKLAVNCVINPLTALLGCRNGDLFLYPAGNRLASQICCEISNVFRAQWRHEIWGLPNTKLDERNYQLFTRKDSKESEDTPSGEYAVREPMLENPFPAGLSRQQLFQECVRVAEVTRENTSSMLVDIRRSRSTEISYLNGYILKLAKKYNVNVPVTATLIDLILLRQAIPIDKPVPLQSVL